MTAYEQLPPDLPRPVDDGAADHLPGRRLPPISLRSTADRTIELNTIPGRSVIYIYPKTGRPDEPMPPGWESIPGARGCTPESCGFRDHHNELAELGVGVLGLSSQTTDYQLEMTNRLNLPFPVLSDPTFDLAAALRLPTFEAFGERLYTRLTLSVDDGVIDNVWYPVFPTDTHATTVTRWISEQAHH